MEWMFVSLTTICQISTLSFIATLRQQHMKMLEQIGLLCILSFSYITYNQVCIVIHQGLENIETFSSRSRLLLQDRDQESRPRLISRPRPLFYVLEAPRDQDQGLETTSLVLGDKVSQRLKHFCILLLKNFTV